MPYGDLDSCRLEIRHADGKVDARPWLADGREWPPRLGQLIHDEDAAYRVASIQRDGAVNVIVALPAQRGARRL